MPIYDNVVLVREGGENEGEEPGALIMSTSPRHPIFSYQLVLHISEAVKPIIFLEIVTYVLKVRGLDIQNGAITHEHLDKKLASL